MKSILPLIFLSTALTAFSQSITAKQLLKNTITYHDPNNTWANFNGTFTVVMSTPNASKRTSNISINLPAEYFNIEAKRDTTTTTYTMNKGKCKKKYNGKILDSLNAKAKNMSCDRATHYKNYYTYLYGLPMKLKRRWHKPKSKRGKENIYG